MRPGRSRLGAALGLALALGACHASGKDQKGTAPPGERGVGGGDALGDPDDIDRIEAELRQAELELQTVDGSRVEAGVEAGQERPSPEGPGRCERIEVLAARICELRDRVCALADEHTEQPRYAQACGRAEQTCEQAQQAAQQCTGG